MKKLLQIFIAIIPLIVSFSTSDPTLAIRFLVFSIVICGVLVYYLFSNKSIYKEVITHHAMLAFAVVIIAYIFSAFYNGFGSESIYIILKLFLLYVFAIIVIQFVIQEGYKSLLNSFLYFSLILSVIYFYQIIANYSDIISIKSEWQRDYEFGAIAATMGNRNLLSSIQFLMLPVLIYIQIIGKRVFKILSGLAILLILITFFQTQTKAVLFATGFFCCSLLLFHNRKIYNQYFIGLILGTGIFLASSYAIMSYSKRYDPLILEINNALDFTSSQRYKLYKSSLSLIADHPIFGVGPGNWKIDICQYDLYIDALGNSFAQRPHNDFLWVFSEGGLVAGISYILIFLILLRDSFLLHKNRKKEDGIIYSLLFATVMGYGFISLFDFPMERFSHNIIFFILAAIIIASRIKQKGFSKDKIPPLVSYILFFITCFSVYVATIRYKGEIHLVNALHFTKKGDWDYVIKAIDKAYYPSYYEMENTSTPLLWYRGVAYFNQQKYNEAIDDFKTAYKVNSNHVHVLNNLATSYQMKGDSEKSKKYYREIFKVNPTFKQGRINLAAILFNEKKFGQALDVILKSEAGHYWQRKKNNFQHNYDLYLKTIVEGWTVSVYVDANNKQKKALDGLRQIFDKEPNLAALKMRNIFMIKQKEDIDYLTALMLVKQKFKSKLE